MRLIDADRLKAAIHTDFSEHFTLYHDTDQTALFDMVMDDIDEMPTAFDKEKVTQELKSNMESAQLAQSLVGTDLVQCGGFSYGYYNGVKDAVKIVEKGGIE